MKAKLRHVVRQWALLGLTSIILFFSTTPDWPAQAAQSNRLPVAYAGTDQTVGVADTVVLDGSGSSDADGNLLSFHWSFVSRPSGSIATLSNPLAVRPTFQ